LDHAATSQNAVARFATPLQQVLRMPDRWTIDESEIVTSECTIRVSEFFQRDLVRYSEPVFDSYVRGWVRDARTRGLLLGIHEMLRGSRTAGLLRPASELRDEAVVTSLKEAFRQRQLLLLRPRRSTVSAGSGSAAATAAAGQSGPGSPGSAGSAAAAAPAEEKKAKELTWIQFELVDEDMNPLYEEYELTDSSNAVRSATFSKEAPVFRREKIPEGEWKIRFPKLHDNNWKPPGKK
jgi:hypothetical protein